MTVRNLARISATSLLAVGALGFAATPALAADVDFGVKAVGSTIAANASGKFAKITISNNGTTKPDAVDIKFDASKLDMSKVAVADLGECTFDKGIAFCALNADSVPAPGGSTDLGIPLKKVAGATGSAGKLTIEVGAKGDTNKANDKATVDVTVGESGADLGVIAEDVSTPDADGNPTGKPVQPGEIGSLYTAYVNQGDMIADGLKIEIKLPKQTAFAQEIEGCEISADKRTFTCEVPGVPLIPADEDKNQEDDQISEFGFSLPVLVSADAKGPVSLKPGSVTATALEQKAFSAARKSRAAAPKLPKGLAPLMAPKAEVDADPSDNTDDFVVLVAGPAAAGGGEGGQGGGGGLPVTGPAAFALGGGGLAAVGLGLAMFFVARRRKVVLVTPGDEK